MIITMNIPVHKPVLTTEVVEALNIESGKNYIDCTLGLGGHARAIIEKAYPGRLLGIDAYPEAIWIARDNLADYAGSITFINDNFNNLENICRENDFSPVDGASVSYAAETISFTVGATVVGDVDGDGDVDLTDLSQLLSNYGMTSGATWEDGDMDGDGDVDLTDLSMLLANYGYGT